MVAMTSPYHPSSGHGDRGEEIIIIQPMRFLVEAINPDDDWTGLTARSERKKRQNRLNQRAYRRRRDAHAASLSSRSSCTSSTAPSHPSPESKNTSKHVSESSQPRNRKNSPSIEIFVKHTKKPFEFPLSTDHLMLLVQYNLFRACLSNMETLSIHVPHQLTITNTLPANMPPAFEPTNLQRSIMHPAWIDSVPSPVIRDNFIRNWGAWDPDDYWFDTVGDLHEAYEKPLMIASNNTSGKKNNLRIGEDFGGLMCWGDPWLIESYEITPWYLKKWWKLLSGCEGLYRGTNKWRELRGEDPLSVDDMCKDLDGCRIKSEDV